VPSELLVGAMAVSIPRLPLVAPYRMIVGGQIRFPAIGAGLGPDRAGSAGPAQFGRPVSPRRAGVEALDASHVDEGQMSMARTWWESGGEG
jgi:hypothetical protein